MARIYVMPGVLIENEITSPAERHDAIGLTPCDVDQDAIARVLGTQRVRRSVGRVHPNIHGYEVANTIVSIHVCDPASQLGSGSMSSARSPGSGFQLAPGLRRRAGVAVFNTNILIQCWLAPIGLETASVGIGLMGCQLVIQYGIDAIDWLGWGLLRGMSLPRFRLRGRRLAQKSKSKILAAFRPQSLLVARDAS
jgi:hypothetical protein